LQGTLALKEKPTSLLNLF